MQRNTKDFIKGYLDANATHPLLPAVREAWARAILERDPVLSNPSSIHRKGQQAKKFVAALKDELTTYLGRPDGDEFVFSSGATESINTVIRGFCKCQKDLSKNVFLVATTVEHSAVVDTIVDVSEPHYFVPVRQDGSLDESALLSKLDEVFETDPTVQVLFSIQLANNETGYIFDLPRLLGTLWHRYGPRRIESVKNKTFGDQSTMTEQRLFVLVDAVQGLGKIEEAFVRKALHYADYAIFSGHKLGAPTGIGALWVRPGAPYKSLITGGTQERRRRAGTFNVYSAYGLWVAIQDWKVNGDRYRARMRELKSALQKGLEEIPGLYFHAPVTSDENGFEWSLCNTVNFHIEGCPEESLLLNMDIEGFCVSSGSACNSGSLKPSRVLLAMGFTKDQALSSLRVSVGVETTDQEVSDFVETLKKVVVQIREARERAKTLLAEIKA